MSMGNPFANAHPFKRAFLRTTTGIFTPCEKETKTVCSTRTKYFWLHENLRLRLIQRKVVESLLTRRTNLPVPPHPGEREPFAFVAGNKNNQKSNLTCVNIPSHSSKRGCSSSTSHMLQNVRHFHYRQSQAERCCCG